MLSFAEVGVLLGLAVVVAVMEVREVLDEQDAAGALVAGLTALLWAYILHLGKILSPLCASLPFSVQKE